MREDARLAPSMTRFHVFTTGDQFLVMWTVGHDRTADGFCLVQRKRLPSGAVSPWSPEQCWDRQADRDVPYTVAVNEELRLNCDAAARHFYTLDVKVRLQFMLGTIPVYSPWSEAKRHNVACGWG